MFHMTRRNIMLLSIGAFILVLIAIGMYTPPVPADFALIERGPMRVTVDEEGQTRMEDVYVISADLTGRLLRVETEVGDWVTAGETVLAELLPVRPELLDRRSREQAEADLRSADANIVVAEADLQRAIAELEFAESEVARAEILAERGTISESALDAAMREAATKAAAVETARAVLVARRAERESAAARLIAPEPTANGNPEPLNPVECCIQLTSPVDGWVLQLMQESEAVVASGTPILEIGDPTTVEIISDLLSSDAVRVSNGAYVEIDGWGGDVPLEGRVQRVEPYGFTKISALGIDEQRVNVIIDLVGDPDTWTRLGHGFRVDVHIDVWSSEDVLKVPVGALFRADNEWAVFVVEGGDARLRRIVLGMMNNEEAQILQGLEPGEIVILHPGDRIDEGIGVEPRSG